MSDSDLCRWSMWCENIADEIVTIELFGDSEQVPRCAECREDGDIDA